MTTKLSPRNGDSFLSNGNARLPVVIVATSARFSPGSSRNQVWTSLQQSRLPLFLDDSLRLSLITIPFFLSLEMQRVTVPESRNCTRFLLLVHEISPISFFRSSKAMLEAKIFLLPFRYLQDETREEFPDQTSRWQSRLFEDRASVHSSAAFLFLEGGGREEKAEARSSEGGSKKNVHKWKSAIESPFKRYLTPPPPSLRFLHPQLESCLGRHGFHSPPT